MGKGGRPPREIEEAADHFPPYFYRDDPFTLKPTNMRLLLSFLLIPSLCFSQSFTSQEIARYRAKAQRVTIIRDNWGVPHIYGKGDADAVFGLLYAQCEENFPRVERNYLEMMGRLSEVEGKAQLYKDLQMQLLYDTAAAKKDFSSSPAWFQKLLNAFADGV